MSTSQTNSTNSRPTVSPHVRNESYQIVDDLEGRVIDLMMRKVSHEDVKVKGDKKIWVTIAKTKKSRIEVSIEDICQKLEIGQLPKKKKDVVPEMLLRAEHIFRAQRHAQLVGLGVSADSALTLAGKIVAALTQTFRPGPVPLHASTTDSPRYSDSPRSVSSTASTPREALIQSEPNVYIPKFESESLYGGEGYSVRAFGAVVTVSTRSMLGAGAFKKVRESIYAVGKKYRLLAKLSTNLSKLDQKGVQRAKREAEILLLLKDCPGIARIRSVHYYDAEKVTMNKGVKIVLRSQKQAIYQKKYDKDIDSLVRHYDKFDDPMVLFIAERLLMGVKSFHSRDIIHNDLKPANCQVSIKDNKIADVVINDFGLATFKGEDTKGGTVSFKPPEAFKDGQYSSKAADMWAVGCILYYARNRSYHPASDRISKGEIGDADELVKLMDFYPDGEPANKRSLDHLIWRMTRLDSKERATVDEALEFFIQS